jgi:hypothetical protein
VRLGAPPGTPSCGNLHASYTLTPQQLTGTTGTDHEVTRSFDVTGGVDHFGSATFCRYSILGEGGLKVGVWRIRIVAPLDVFSCTEQLDAGQNSVFFTAGSAGCARNGFPP